MPCVTINVKQPNIVVKKVWTNPTEVEPSQEFEVWARVKTLEQLLAKSNYVQT